MVYSRGRLKLVKCDGDTKGFTEPAGFFYRMVRQLHKLFLESQLRSLLEWKCCSTRARSGFIRSNTCQVAELFSFCDADDARADR